MNWEIRMDRSAQLHIKQLVGRSAWCSDDLEEWDQGGPRSCVRMADAFRHMAESNTVKQLHLNNNSNRAWIYLNTPFLPSTV